MALNDKQITNEEAWEVINSAIAGYSVEVWLPNKGLLIVNYNLSCDFDFTQWEVYQAPCEPVTTTWEQGQAWELLISLRTTGINV